MSVFSGGVAVFSSSFSPALFEISSDSPSTAFFEVSWEISFGSVSVAAGKLSGLFWGDSCLELSGACSSEAGVSGSSRVVGGMSVVSGISGVFSS